MKIYFSKKFISQYQLLAMGNAKLAKKIKSRVKIFTQNPHHPLLKTHRLSGKLKDYWAFWISWDLRIVFQIIDRDKIRFLTIGRHDQVYISKVSKRYHSSHPEFISGSTVSKDAETSSA